MRKVILFSFLVLFLGGCDIVENLDITDEEGIENIRGYIADVADGKLLHSVALSANYLSVPNRVSHLAVELLDTVERKKIVVKYEFSLFTDPSVTRDTTKHYYKGYQCKYESLSDKIDYLTQLEKCKAMIPENYTYKQVKRVQLFNDECDSKIVFTLGLEPVISNDIIKSNKFVTAKTKTVTTGSGKRMRRKKVTEYTIEFAMIMQEHDNADIVLVRKPGNYRWSALSGG
ncbi:hypothetical protein [Dysgonomonas sp. 25]|uniref:hypothetical protein n=1 Tax=Dysgonomonas sp. 25 TaxID=2302933 RepID=UPI0013D39BBD|nr:hypothetical protein [Dysgonomonas sp. 25]NDV70340.1 hypothetical protein [Dysgonomonas sp. 25]